MSVIDVEALLAPISAEAPAGADVEFDPAFFELDQLAQGTPERVMGDEVKPAEEPDFKEVKAKALALFEKTRDLRVAMILAAALLKEDGLVGFRDGVAVVKGLIERMWDQFFPALDPSDNNDPTIRVNILKGFDGDDQAGDTCKFKLRLRAAPLTDSQRVGRFSYRDIQVARGEVPAPLPKEGQQLPPPPDIKLITAAFEDTATESLQAVQATLAEISDLLTAIDTALLEKVGAGVGPDMTGLKDLIKAAGNAVAEQLAKRGVGEAPVAEGASADAGGGGVGGGGALPRPGGVALTGEISSRTDVLRVLDKICEYYERFEPTSPVPIFMQRAKRLVTMNFVDLIKDLAPEAMSKIDVFTGAPPSS